MLASGGFVLGAGFVRVRLAAQLPLGPPTNLHRPTIYQQLEKDQQDSIRGLGQLSTRETGITRRSLDGKTHYIMIQRMIS